MKASLVLVFLLCVFAWGFVLSHKPNVGRIALVRVEDAFSTLKTGDMIFTKSKNWTSKVQTFFFGSYVNHCAMVFKASDNSLWIWDLAPQVGAYMTPLREFVRNNWAGRPPNPQSPPIDLQVPYVVPRSGRVGNALAQRSALFIRRSHFALDQQKVLEFIQKNLGRPYSWRFWLSAYVRVTGLEFPLGWSLATDPLGMFCSELIAHTFIHAGALHPVLNPPPSILPVHFWENNLQWMHGHGLLPPEQLIGSVPPLDTHADITRWEDGIATTPEVVETLVNLLHVQES